MKHASALGVFGALMLAGAAAEAADWGAFASNQCVSNGVRSFASKLQNIRSNNWDDECKHTPASINGQTFATPTKCENKGAFGMWGEWHVRDATCGASAPGTRSAHWDGFLAEGCYDHASRKYSARLLDISGYPSWTDACVATPAVIKGTSFRTPKQCNLSPVGVWGEWAIPDATCQNAPVAPPPAPLVIQAACDMPAYERDAASPFPANPAAEGALNFLPPFNLILPLTTPIGYLPTQAIRLVRDMRAANTHPACFRKIMDEERVKLETRLAVSATRNAPLWNQGSAQACAAASDMFGEVIEALHNHYVLARLPPPILEGTRALMHAARPLACAIGTGAYQIKEVAVRLINTTIPAALDAALYLLHDDQTAMEASLKAFALDRMGTSTMAIEYSKRVTAMLKAAKARDASTYATEKRGLQEASRRWLNFDNHIYAQTFGAFLKSMRGIAVDKMQAYLVMKIRDSVKHVSGMARNSGTTGIGTIPYVGGVLSTLAGAIFDEGHEALLSAGLTPAKIVITNVLDALIDALTQAIEQQTVIQGRATNVTVQGNTFTFPANAPGYTRLVWSIERVKRAIETNMTQTRTEVENTIRMIDETTGMGVPAPAMVAPR